GIYRLGNSSAAPCCRRPSSASAATSSAGANASRAVDPRIRHGSAQKENVRRAMRISGGLGPLIAARLPPSADAPLPARGVPPGAGDLPARLTHLPAKWALVR